MVNINQVVKPFVAISIALIVVVFAITRATNVIGSLGLYLAIGGLCLSLYKPKWGVFLLFFYGGYLDVYKRLMILDSVTTQKDLAVVLIVPVATLLGCVINYSLGLVKRWGRNSKKEIVTYLMVTAVGATLGVAYAFNGQFSLRALGTAANASIFWYLLLLIPHYFKSREELIHLFKSVVIMYIPAALWCIKQGIWGIADFEYDYLVSGLTIEIRQLNQLVFRNMGSMVSASILSMVVSIFVVSHLIPVSFKRNRLYLGSLFEPWRLIKIVIFAVSAYYTFSRTGWVCGLAVLAIFVCLQSKGLFVVTFAAGLLTLGVVYQFSGQLHESRVLNRIQADLHSNATSDEEKQTLVVGTLEGRLSSMSEFASNPDIWTPFGLKLAGKTQDEVLKGKWVHDVLTETLVLIGYIPLAIIGAGGCFIFLRVFRNNFRLRATPDRLYFRYFLACGAGCLVSGLSQGKVLFTYPLNLFWLSLFGICYGFYSLAKESELKMVEKSTF